MKAVLEELQPVETGHKRLVGRLIFGVLVLLAAVVGAAGGLLLVYSTDLPQVEALEHYRPVSSSELYDIHGKTIGSFALQRRVVSAYKDFPPVLIEALVSIEDKEFYRHWGINVWRIAGAAFRDIESGGKVQGASTLTMQLARNLFLSPDRSFHRKIEEALLAIQIERRFTKQQILTLYGNQIYLGHGVYGFEAASEYYFSKPARQLTLPEAALIAGLPKSPVFYSPINHPERALHRRNLVINGMLEDGKITVAQADTARNAPLGLNLQHDPNSLAPYFVEEVRQYLENKYGADEVHAGGLRVFTTIDMDWQSAANAAVLDGLAAYEHRHGWRGHLENVLFEGQTLAGYQHPDWVEQIAAGTYVHGLVTAVSLNGAAVKIGGYTATLSRADVAWTKTPMVRLLARGDVVYVKVLALESDAKARVSLEQDSGVQGALLAIDNASGGVRAMVGGRDFNLSKFNRATQALRQVGSSFKPYVYTAAIDQGATPDDTIVDSPVIFQTDSGQYFPHNYDNKYEGTITLLRALAQSRNIPALKLADKIGIRTVEDYARKFGITSPLPPYLPVALGAAEMTLLEQTSAYSVFPDDGVRLVPRFVTKVTDYDDRVLEEDYPDVRDVISSRTARIMTSMLEAVVQHGTGVAATRLKVPLGGKTGTTNDFTDAWFVGFSPGITTGVWVGYDEKRSLGAKETGAHAALPIWMQFMSAALAGKDPGDFQPPPELPQKPTAQTLDTPDLAPPGDEGH
ncbi:MAG TPA: PBP1A family penicillin-binding protein [Terriglobales bacterium]|jgi:penicillin-binding protein 1A|nr:PBP1A family penicillin-binding protein [Terriglobales bacterium]